MNTFGTRVISQRATGAARWATAASVPAGHGVHFGGGGILLALLVLVALGFGVSRMRRGRHTKEHDDDWGRRQPPSAPASPASAAAPPRLGHARHAARAVNAGHAARAEW